MGRTLRRNIKNQQAAPFLTYILRKWKKEVDDLKQERSYQPPPPPPITIPLVNIEKNWADWDDTDDDELPELPPWLASTTPPPSPPVNPWKVRIQSQAPDTPPARNSPIRHTNEYFYKNS